MKHKKLFICLGIAAGAIVAIELVLYAITGAFGRSAFHCLFSDDPELKKTKTEYIWPVRGEILDCKGRVLATNHTVWDVHLDCTVLQAPKDEWETLASDLAKELEGVLGKKTAGEYYAMLNNGRAEQKKFLKICEDVEDSVATALMNAPLLNMGQFDGGAIFTQNQVRNYPYGRLGRRTIGYSYNGITYGLEGAYDILLSGKTGKVEYVRRNKKGKYYWKEKSRENAIDGMDVTTTFDMDLMTIVDAELRAAIEGRKDVKSACAVLMDVKNGAIRAMANLMSGQEGDVYDEISNMAIANDYEPGSILTKLPQEILENGLDSAKIDIEGLRDARYLVDEDGNVNLFCTPLHVLKIFAGIANGGKMFDPYLVTPSTSRTLCSTETGKSERN